MGSGAWSHLYEIWLSFEAEPIQAWALEWRLPQGHAQWFLKDHLICSVRWRFDSVLREGLILSDVKLLFSVKFIYGEGPKICTGRPWAYNRDMAPDLLLFLTSGQACIWYIYLLNLCICHFGIFELLRPRKSVLSVENDPFWDTQCLWSSEIICFTYL